MKRIGLGVLVTVLGGAPAFAGDEAAITEIIEGSAKAMSALPESQDPRSVLKHYASDYDSITDGQPQTLQNLESVVGEIEENVRLGNPVAITNRASNVRVHVAGAIGWATFEFYSKIEVLGEVLGEVERRCTGIFRKSDAAWKIRHEHCSTSWAAPPPQDGGPEAAPENAPLEG